LELKQFNAGYIIITNYYIFILFIFVIACVWFILTWNNYM
jgi:hypothetical protein